MAKFETDPSSLKLDTFEQFRCRLAKLKRLDQIGELAFKNKYKPNHLASELHSEFDPQSREALSGVNTEVLVAGRVVAIRDFGKAAFLQLQDRSGRIQVYFQKSQLGLEKYTFFKDFLDLGDFIRVKGTLFKTKTEELSINALDFNLLTKALRPLPEKFHGISDIEIKYRQRYLDFIMNQASKTVFIQRAKMIQGLRNFFLERAFIEVETPMMHPVAGGAAARPFVTHHHALDQKLFMRIAPELYLKRLVVGGFERVFELNRNFRNEGISIKHNPEFTMLEFYQAYSTFEDLMSLLEDLIGELAVQLTGSFEIVYQKEAIGFQKPWARLTVEEAIIRYTSFHNRSQLRNSQALYQYGEKRGLAMDPTASAGELMMQIFEDEVEPQLIQPVFITHYPLSVSPLSRKNEQDPFLADRFELYIYGREIANGFSELNDPIDQRLRFEEQKKLKDLGNPEACEIDEDYLVALEHGMPPTAGAGLGVDRLVMLLTNATSIRDVICFPLMRPLSE